MVRTRPYNCNCIYEKKNYHNDGTYSNDMKKECLYVSTLPFVKKCCQNNLFFSYINVNTHTIPQITKLSAKIALFFQLETFTENYFSFFSYIMERISRKSTIYFVVF